MPRSASSVTLYGSQPPARRSAAVRKRLAQGGEPRQKSVELAGIPGGEHAREPAIAGVVDGQCRLHACQLLVAREKGVESATELTRFRNVFRIIDGNERSLRERKRDIERLRFGTRSEGRRNDDRKRWAEIEPGKRAPGLVIVGFQDEFHIQFFTRIVRYYGANATKSGLTLWIEWISA